MRVVNKVETQVFGYDQDLSTQDIEIKEVYLTKGEHRAYSITRLGKEMGLEPSETLNEMKENGLTGDEMRAGTRAYELEKQGYKIFGDSSGFKRQPRTLKLPPGTFKGVKI